MRPQYNLLLIVQTFSDFTGKLDKISLKHTVIFYANSKRSYVQPGVNINNGEKNYNKKRIRVYSQCLQFIPLYFGGDDDDDEGGMVAWYFEAHCKHDSI